MEPEEIDTEDLLQQQKQQLKEELRQEKAEQSKARFSGRSLVEEASWWSRCLFSWTYPIIRYARSN